jgi:hypothetical protein
MKKSCFFLNFVMFLPWRHRRCLKADPLVQRHLTAKPSNRMLMSLSQLRISTRLNGFLVSVCNRLSTIFDVLNFAQT